MQKINFIFDLYSISCIILLKGVLQNGDVMGKKTLTKTNLPDNAILDFHISAYLDQVGKVIFLVLIVNLLAEIVTCTLVKMGYFAYFLESQNNVKLSFHYFFWETFAKTVLSWIIYFVYLILYKKSSFPKRKLLVCIVMMILTSVFIFGHWKYSYLSILYSVPVVITTPLGKKPQKVVLIISLLLTACYSIFQAALFKTEYNFLIATVSITTIATFYFISSTFYSSMSKAISDIEKFFLISTKLNDEIAHDYSTGALSKVTLHQDLLAINEYKSIAFIDLDNFKEINDSKGHSTGDHILKNIVRCCKSRNLKIYRYGGDEFVILSPLPVQQLAEEIEKVKLAYATSSETLFSCEATFSAGVMPFLETNDMNDLVRQCDEVMYISKNNGKNKVTVQY